MPSGHECRQCVAPVQTSAAPVQRKNKYSCLVKRIRANGLKHQTLPLMGATRLASGLKQGLTDRCDLVLSVSLYLVYGQGIFPTRDASPPLEVAFGVRVRRMFTFYQTAIKNESSADSCERYLHYFLLWLSTLLHPKVQSADKMLQKSVWGVYKRFLGQCVHTHFSTLTTLPCCVRIMFIYVLT